MQIKMIAPSGLIAGLDDGMMLRCMIFGDNR